MHWAVCKQGLTYLLKTGAHLRITHHHGLGREGKRTKWIYVCQIFWILPCTNFYKVFWGWTIETVSSPWDLQRYCTKVGIVHLASSTHARGVILTLFCVELWQMVNSEPMLYTFQSARRVNYPTLCQKWGRWFNFKKMREFNFYSPTYTLASLPYLGLTRVKVELRAYLD